MERRDRAPLSIAAFVAAEPLIGGQQLTLGEEAAHHMRVRRLAAGEAVRVLDGVGHVADARIVRLARAHAVVDVGAVTAVVAPPAVHMLVPVGDRDRMLMLAEKCAEIGATSWRPVTWRRSRSVTPRGEGPGFQGKVRARMTHALAQSGGGWLPLLFPDATPERAAAAAPPGTRLLLDPEGHPVLDHPLREPLSIAVGPEGGVEPEERDQLVAAGFAPVALAGNILRFETAGVAALAIARAVLARAPTPHA